MIVTSVVILSLGRSLVSGLIGSQFIKYHKYRDHLFIFESILFEMISNLLFVFDCLFVCLCR